jgi:hypothetical protein
MTILKLKSVKQTKTDYIMWLCIVCDSIILLFLKTTNRGDTMKIKTNLQDRDDLSTRDKGHWPEVSSSRRLLCIAINTW